MISLLALDTTHRLPIAHVHACQLSISYTVRLTNELLHGVSLYLRFLCRLQLHANESYSPIITVEGLLLHLCMLPGALWLESHVVVSQPGICFIVGWCTEFNSLLEDCLKLSVSRDYRVNATYHSLSIRRELKLVNDS